MPCTYTSIDIKEKQMSKEQEKQKQNEKKRKTLLLILNEMGYTDIKEESLLNNNLLITGKKQ